MEDTNKKFSSICKWYVKTSKENNIKKDDDNDIEFASYVHMFCDEMYDLVLLLNYSGFSVRKIFEWSRQGELVVQLDNAKKIIYTIQDENIERYNELVDALDEYINEPVKKEVKKLHMAVNM